MLFMIRLEIMECASSLVIPKSSGGNGSQFGNLVGVTIGSFDGFHSVAHVISTIGSVLSSFIVGLFASIRIRFFLKVKGMV